MMIYAERLGNDDEEYIAERGIFLSVSEFVPYRQSGWSSTPDINDMADRIIVEAASNSADS